MPRQPHQTQHGHVPRHGVGRSAPGERRRYGVHPDRERLILLHQEALRRLKHPSVVQHPMGATELMQSREDIAKLAEHVGHLGG